jgi:hypothetical protein
LNANSLLPDNFNLESFIKKYSALEEYPLAVKLKKDFGSRSAFLAEQIKLHKKAKEKLPSFSKCFCLYTAKSIEQSSSEPLAEFKSRHFAGNKMLDLTGGLGVDDWALSGTFKKVISVDNDYLLNKIARYNFIRLGIKNIERIDGDAYEFIKIKNSFDLIYIDADRRVKPNGKKSVTLHDPEPSFLKLKKNLFELTGKILLKLSPLIDLSYLAKSIPEIQDIYVVSLNNEVKEILGVINKTFTGISKVIAVDLSPAGIEKEFSGKPNENIEPKYDYKGKYFYEPANVLIKSGLTPKYAAENGLRLVAKNSVYLLGDKLINGFFGRKFKIISGIPFSKSGVKKYLKESGITKANMSKRNFPLAAAEISKLFKLKDGGDEYLFFTTDRGKQKIMYHTRKL